jgi:regulation of enolase protein 1 (concanavalin A-like superfamily)
MKNIRSQILQITMLLCLALGLSARAGTLINSFDLPSDYLANGVIGDTNWDGVYLGAGDVPGGNVGGSGNGTALVANSTDFSGYLSLQTTSGDWGDSGDDGFFLWKRVAGDFDVSVETVPPFQNLPYNFAGLMVRPYHTNNSGAPFSTTLTNDAENYVCLWRFNEYDIDGQIRVTTNNATAEFNFGSAGSTLETNSSRFFRITRVGDVFTFYVKTNAGDSWSQVTGGLPAGTLTRGDWAGMAVQVGIAQAVFSGNSPAMYFDNFQLSGPNVTFPAMPAAPSNLTTNGQNAAGWMSFTWSVGTPGNGSLLVLSEHPIRGNPINGLTYAANSTYGNSSALLGGGGQYVVYNGTGTSVTVTNLGANNRTYYAAVFEYSGSGSSTVYNTASPATNAFPGPGIITSASISAPTNNIPAGGAVALRLVAGFSTGETSDQTANTTWVSDNTTVADVSAGTVSGLTTGSANITATFGSFVLSTNITVHAPAFTDNFSTTHDYVANGLQGSKWDGLFLNYGDVPGANKGADAAAGQTFVLKAETNVLSLQAAGGTWRGAGSDGTYLFKVVRGDFQASVHVTCGVINNNYAGLMARLFNDTGTTNEWAGGGTGGTETHINWGNPQNGTASARRTIDGGGTTTVAGLANDRWFLMQRVNSTNFYFYEKSSSNGLWSAVTAATMVVPQAAGNAPMQVGLFQEMRTASTDTAQYDNLMIDGPGIVSPAGTPAPPAAGGLTATLNPDLTATFTWYATNADGTPVASILVMRDGGPVTAQPTYGLAPGYGGAFGAGVSLGDGNYVVARSSSSPASATVTGLTPGHTYYAAVYTFAGAYPDRVYNSVLPALGATASVLDGVLQSVFVQPVPSIPLGGLQVAQVYGVYGGFPVNVSQFATITVADTNVVQFADGAFSGMSLGSTTAKSVFAGITNIVNLTVRAPSFTDDFNANHDYLASGVAGTSWDGVYRQGIDTNEVPHSPYVPGTGMGTAVADANVTSNGCLTISSAGDGWENDVAGGFFLFKYVAGDFQAAVRISSYDIANYNQPGMLARAYSTGTNGTTIGAPFVIGPARTNKWDIPITTYGESWVSLTRFDEFNIGTYARLTLDSATDQVTQPQSETNNYCLLIQRTASTGFNFYMRVDSTQPWRLLPNKTAFQQAQFAGAPMQVGIMAGPWSGANRTVSFEQFMLDKTTGSPLQCNVVGGNAILSWPPMPNAQVQSTTNVASPSWEAVPGTPTLGPSGYTLFVPLTSGNKFFRLVE